MVIFIYLFTNLFIVTFWGAVLPLFSTQCLSLVSTVVWSFNVIGCYWHV